MFERQVLVSGIAAAMVLVGIALAPANADFREPAVPVAKQVGVIAMASLTSPETPQDQVYDMTYGELRFTAIEAPAAESSNADEPIVDYSFG